jgi:hypothetical protein
MTQRSLAPLILCLLATLLFVTALSPDADGPTASPPPLADLLIFRPANSPLPTPTPTPIPACNRPASDMPPRPDGCYGGEFPVAPPPQPIPPPCIVAWTVEEWDEDGQPVTDLLITVEHPELQSYAPRGWVHLANYGDAWQLVAVDAQVSCGKDEAPLAWATLQILNGSNRDAALAIYTGPLPADYLDAIAPLASEHNTHSSVYLPLVAKDATAVVPTASEYHP